MLHILFFDLILTLPGVRTDHVFFGLVTTTAHLAIVTDALQSHSYSFVLEVLYYEEVYFSMITKSKVVLDIFAT